MRYQKFSPVKELQPFIECYFIWEGETIEPLDVQSPPNCFGAIVFNYGDSNWAYQSSPELSLVPDSFICGLLTSNYHRVLKGKIGMAGIVFKASAIHNFFGLRMSTLVNGRMPLEILLQHKAHDLVGEIKNGISDEDRIRVLEKFITPRLPEAKKKLSIIDEAVEFIDQRKGIVSVDEVAAHLKISRRYLEKGFLEKVGVSPKFYARIKRFVIVSLKVAYHEKVDWQDAVEESGFHDQSHLVKEYHELNKMSPTEYLQKHREMTRFLKD